MFDRPMNRWWNVVAGFIGNAGGAGVITTYVLGIFTKSVAAEFGWGRSFATAGLAVFFVVAGIGAVVFGSIISRWSLRGSTILFVAIFSAAIMSVSILPASVILFCLVFSLIGFSGAAANPMPYGVAIGAQFDRRRGLALAISASGAGIGALLLPGYASWLLERFGWRGGYLGVGFLIGVITLFALIFLFRNPRRKVSYKPDEGPSLKELYATSGTLWLIAISIFCVSASLTGVISNIAPIMTDRGATVADAAALVGLIGAVSWISRLGVGLLLDHFHPRYIAALAFLVAGLGIALFSLATSGFWLYVGVALIGLGIGSEADLVTYIISRYFPGAAMGRAMGAVWIFWAWGNGVGVFLASLTFDLMGNYHFALAAFAIMPLIGAFLMSRLGSYDVVPASEEKQASSA